MQFFNDATIDINQGFYDLAIFHADQALQLYLKAVLLELFAFEARFHGLRSLLSYLSKFLRENGYQENAREIDELTSKFREYLITLESSYIDSRYGDIEYDKSLAEEILSLTDKIIKKIEEIVKRVKLG